MTRAAGGHLYLLEVSYDGKSGRAVLRLYDEESQRIVEVPDQIGHKPYLLTDFSPEELVQRHPEVIKHRGFDHVEVVEKYDALRDTVVRMTKVVARDPLSVGGTRSAIRELLGDHAWEAKIKYHHCYVYDLGFVPGMPYLEVDGKLQPAPVELPENIIESLRKLYGDSEETLLRAVEWAKLFQAPVPSLKRVAIDIEVYSPEPDRIPRPDEAPYTLRMVLKKCFYSGVPSSGRLQRTSKTPNFSRARRGLLREHSKLCLATRSSLRSTEMLLIFPT
jgi:DNA polymerase I